MTIEEMLNSLAGVGRFDHSPEARLHQELAAAVRELIAAGDKLGNAGRALQKWVRHVGHLNVDNDREFSAALARWQTAVKGTE